MSKLRKITVVLAYHKLTIIPDTCYVFNGEEVQWDFISTDNYEDLEWDIYFDTNKSITKQMLANVSPASITTKNKLLTKPVNKNKKEDDFVTHQGQSYKINVNITGSHKYGIKVTDRKTNNVVDDDDPMLIVM